MEFPELMDIELQYLKTDVDSELTVQNLRDIRDVIIGSNRCKKEVIERGIVPKLIELLRDESKDMDFRLISAIILGSLAKGTEENINSLVQYNIPDILLEIVLANNNNNNMQLIEVCLGTIKTIFQFISNHHDSKILQMTQYHSIEMLYSNIDHLTRLIQLASPDTSSINFQSYVVNILLAICNSSKGIDASINLCQAGGIVFLGRLIQVDYIELQFPGLKCLAAMCKLNRAVSDIICVSWYKDKRLLDILTSLTSRTKDPAVQLSAARCLTYISRAGSLSTSDSKIVYKTLPCLARLCTPDFDEDIRAQSAETLAYLAEIDSELQRLSAISNHLIGSLTNLLNGQGQMSASKEAKRGAFRCFASLAANDENIRKRIIDMRGLIEEVLSGLKDDSADVRLAAVRCLHSLSRSVQLLRTTFQDHSVWRPLMDLIVLEKPSDELLTVVTSTICNLLLEFSPAKEPIIENGAIDILCELTVREDAALRLNGSWALMNMAFQADQEVKTRIINTLGTDRIIQLLSDSDTRVIMKTLGLLRNLLSSSVHIDAIMANHSQKIMSALNMVLESNYSSELKEQALCIIGNIAANPQKDYILEDDRILCKLDVYLDTNDQKLKNGSIFVIRNLIARGYHIKLKNFEEKLKKLIQSNEINIPYGDETHLFDLQNDED